MQISGEIVINAESYSFANATAFVYLEDVSRVDGAARILGRAKLTSVVYHQGAESRVLFAVEAIDTPHGDEATLPVHISIDGDENVLARDLVLTTHNAVIEGEFPEISVKIV